MSSNDSTSSSRLSQFGLYRTIDARTEEFLKLSRKRQLRQGCACAAVSTAVTVTVVVSILFLYGYGVSSSASATLRTTSWLDLMNDSTDTTLFDDKFQNSIKFDRASMNLLPVFFDKILDEQESTSQKYEVPTEIHYKRSVFPGSMNPFLAQAKIPTSSLYSIQYKTYPVLYIQSPRNTEYYMKVRKTREYERIMSYIDKMINEKVGIGTRSMRNQQYVTTTEKNTENTWTVPVAVRNTIRVIKNPKDSRATKIIMHSKKIPKELTMPNTKFNNTITLDSKNCNCRNHFGTLLDKIIKCFQEIVKNPSDPPCNKNTQKKITVEIKNQNIKRPTSTKITVATTTSRRPVTKTTSSTTTTKPVTNDPTDIFTITEGPVELFHYSNSFSQKPALPNESKIQPKGLLSQMSPYYIMTGNSNSKNNSKSNILAPIKPKSNIFSFNNHKSKEIKTNDQIFTFPVTENNVEESMITPSTSTTTEFPEKSEEILQNLLFPQTKDLEYIKLPQKAIKEYSSNYILRPRSRERMSKLIKPQKTTKPPTTSTSFSPIQHRTDIQKKVSTENIIDKMPVPHNMPVLPTNKRPFSGLTPEDYIMERIRHGSKKQNKSPEPVTRSNFSVFDKIKNMLKTKLMQPRRKTSYNNLSAQIIKSKTKPKYNEDKRTNSKQKINMSIEYVSKKNLETSPTPYASTASYLSNKITTSTAQIPSVIVGGISSTQLKKYPQDPFLPEITTQPSIKDLNNYRSFTKLERRNIPYNSREDIWSEDDVYTTMPYEENASIKTTTVDPKNNYVSTTTTERVIDVRNSSKDSKEIQAALVDLGLNKIKSINIDEKNAQGSSQTDDNYNPYKYMIPVGRRSYLEISRGDWKQEPHAYDTNAIYDVLDEIDGL